MNKYSSMGNNLDSLHAMYEEFCAKYGTQPHYATIKPVGSYQIVDPGPKDTYDLVYKIWRVHEKKGLDTNNIEKNNPFEMISDYVRCSVLLPHFDQAPFIMDRLLQEFGGTVKVHNRPDYKAFHIHTQNEGLNCEIQLHTKESYALKKITDLHYHKWREEKARNRTAVENNPEYIAEQRIITPLCAEIYDRSGFDQALPLIKPLEKRENKIPPMKYQHMGMIMRLADDIQTGLVADLAAELAIISQLDVQLPSVDDFARGPINDEHTK